MKNNLKIIAIISLIFMTTSQAHAGIFSKFRNWANTGWNNYGWHNGHYHGCPYHNGRNYGHFHNNGFFTNGNITGFTPPINQTFYPSVGNYHSPLNPNGRFNHMPYGMPTMNTPTHVITDFNSTMNTGTGVKILD